MIFLRLKKDIFGPIGGKLHEELEDKMPNRHVNRPVIRHVDLGTATVLTINDDENRCTYVVPHDALFEYIQRERPRTLQTRSWKEKGIYHWPRTPWHLVEFLRNFRI